MAKRKRKGDSDRAPALVERLAYPPPLSKEEWGAKQLSTLMDDERVVNHYERCFRDIIESGRVTTYVNVFTMIAHTGRLPEFDEKSYGKFLSEAQNQHFTATQLQRALDAIFESSGPGGIMQNAAAAWEFLAFVGDFMSRYVEHVGGAEQLSDAIERVNSMALMAYLVAVNAELGIRKDFW